jgi:hypothetical protein
MRLKAQGVIGGYQKNPEDVVKHLLAMQAQDYNGVLWAVGLRTDKATLKDVEQAIADRKIVRTWPMRGTLHFVHADDVHWMLDLLAVRATAAARGRRINQLGLTDVIVDEAEQVLRHGLAGGKAMMRTEIVSLLKENVKGIKIDNQHTQHLMRHFGERGVICFGPHAGKQPTFVLLDEWVGKGARKPREEALAELAKRYFVSHGPATLKDFSGWGMLTMSDAKFGLAQAESELESAEINGTVYYFAPGLKPVSQPETLLLPGFDEYILGYKDRSAVLQEDHAQKVVPGGNGMFLPTVVRDGQVIGLWKRQIKKAGVDYTYSSFYTDDNSDISAVKSEQKYQTFIQS